MDKAAWLATLEYWLMCGVEFRSGDQLEFQTRRSRGHTHPDGRGAQSSASQMQAPHPEGARGFPDDRMTPPGQVGEAAWGGAVVEARHPASDTAPHSASDRGFLTQTRPAVPQTEGQPNVSFRPSPHPLPGRTASPWNKEKPAVSPPTEPVIFSAQPDAPLSPSVPSSERPAMMEAMTRDVASCEQCTLSKTRHKTVFGVGTPDAPVVFVGEGPGAEEDLQGEPFVGAAGRLLDHMLRAIALERSKVFIANVVKCRPPGNRNPQADEISSCQTYLFRQLELIRPKVIVCLGKFAILCLTGHAGTVGKARDQTFSWRGIPVIASYHPAYYLRTPRRKRAAWEDLIRLMKVLEQTEGP